MELVACSFYGKNRTSALVNSLLIQEPGMKSYSGFNFPTVFNEHKVKHSSPFRAKFDQSNASELKSSGKVPRLSVRSVPIFDTVRHISDARLALRFS